MEQFGSTDISNVVKLKTLKLVSANLQSLENFEEAIQYQMRTIKLCEDLEEKINVYQQIANNFLQINDNQQAIQNQIMVYNLVKQLS